jgi:hypothetical protein
LANKYVHLVRRFAGSLWPGGPGAADEAWARGWLVPGEVELWARLSGPDRRHAVGVARRTIEALGDEASTRPVVAAALLHDVGKVDAGYGTLRRSLATAYALVVGHERARSSNGRTGRYLRHDVLGAEMLQAAGSDGLTVAWAREHHLDPSRWSVARPVADALKDADDD